LQIKPFKVYYGCCLQNKTRRLQGYTATRYIATGTWDSPVIPEFYEGI